MEEEGIDGAIFEGHGDDHEGCDEAGRVFGEDFPISEVADDSDSRNFWKEARGKVWGFVAVAVEAGVGMAHKPEEVEGDEGEILEGEAGDFAAFGGGFLGGEGEGEVGEGDAAEARGEGVGGVTEEACEGEDGGAREAWDEGECEACEGGFQGDAEGFEGAGVWHVCGGVAQE